MQSVLYSPKKIRSGANVNAYIVLRKGENVLLPLRKNTGLITVCLDLIQSFLYILEHDYVRIDKKSGRHFRCIDPNIAPVGG